MVRGDYRSDVGAWPRWINLVLGVWLFVSAFIWPHTQASYTNTWILGVLITAVAVWALFVPAVRWANTALAVWLFISTLFIMHISTGTAWNNAIVAALVFIFSLMPSTTHLATPGRPQTTAPA
jgi:hypothetical protein